MSNTTWTPIKNKANPLCGFGYDEFLDRLQQNSSALVLVRAQTPELCMAAVRSCGLALQYVQAQTPELCMAAVQENGLALKYVQVQTTEICMAAVQENDTSQINLFICLMK